MATLCQRSAILILGLFVQNVVQNVPSLTKFLPIYGFPCIVAYPKTGGPCSPPNLSAAEEIDKRTEVFSRASGWLGPPQDIASFKSVSL